MKINKFLIIVPLLLGFLIAQVGQAAIAPPGSSADPVITKSYADKLFRQLNEQIVTLQAEVAKLKNPQPPPPPAAEFTDVAASHWAYGSIKLMVDRDIIKGVSPGKFAPNNNTKRAELVVMLVRALNLDTANTPKVTFKDIPETYWGYPYIAAAYNAGIINGEVVNGSFQPEAQVTRGLMAKWIAKAFEIQRNNKAKDFSDVTPKYWAYDYIMKLADNGITRGYPDGSFKPANKITRAEVAVFMALSIDPARRAKL
ncbi:MAG: S-layer homology domain-containing protein [Bacillota bacterium]